MVASAKVNFQPRRYHMKFVARFLPFFLIALCSIASANNIQERQQKSISQEDKIYVDQADVIFDNQGIRVFLNQNWQVTNAVFWGLRRNGTVM